MEKEIFCRLPLEGLGLLCLTMASYLAIFDFYPIGEEQRNSTSTGLTNVSTRAEECPSDQMVQVSAKGENERNKMEIIRTEHSLPGGSPATTAKAHQQIASSKVSVSSKSAMVEPKKRKRGMAPLDLDPDLLSLAGKAHKTPSARLTGEEGHFDAQKRLSDNHLHNASTPSIPLQRQISTQVRASAERSPSRLQLSTLASVTGINATRNRQVNILAMIEYVSSSTVKPTTAPLKRDVRIVDPTTNKKVTLSVFVDPVNFIPKEYDIILFRDLTTHDFSGGNLNAYPKKCRGKEWYILNPYDTEECDMKSMEAFRAKYRKRKAERPK